VGNNARFHRLGFNSGGRLDPGANTLKRKSQQKIDSSSVDLRALAEYVEQFSSKTIVVLGDFVADVFEFGEISRVSREAPVLILRHRETQLVPGGGANATNNLADLGAKVLPVTIVGDDSNGTALINYFRRKKLDTSRILRVKNWCTPTKTRFLAGWAHTVGQQVLRVDREPQTPLPVEARKKLNQFLFAAIKNADALAISDYGFGVATPTAARELLPRRLTKRNWNPNITLPSARMLRSCRVLGTRLFPR
jgi:rfaE bifunctional protein kinase chain/domain